MDLQKYCREYRIKYIGNAGGHRLEVNKRSTIEQPIEIGQLFSLSFLNCPSHYLKLVRPSSCEELDIKVNDFNESDCYELLQTNSLSKFSISHNISSDCLNFLPTDLKGLRLGSLETSDINEDLKRFISLERLQINIGENANFDSSELDFIKDSLNITDLVCQYFKDANFVKYLSKLSQLKGLTLRFDGPCNYFNCIPAENLSHLIYGGTGINDNELSQLPVLYNLNQLYIGGHPQGLKALDYLREKIPNVELLSLEACNDDSFFDVASTFQNLTFLGIKSLNIEGDGIAKLAACPNLVKLNLSGSGLIGKYSEQIGELKNLKELSLNDSLLKARDFKKLKEALPNTRFSVSTRRK
ncbi:MAG: hypothetical protein MJK11_18905 [Pseudomonadales bacterium]|nr:hypothetical protein [Pseudomonadales bacterium]